MHSARPSSSATQHIINMNPGGGNMSNAPMSAGPVSTMSSFRASPQVLSYSPHPPGSLSPQANASMYTSPRLVQTSGLPNVSSQQSQASTSQLGRSQSLGHAAYQQLHSSQQLASPPAGAPRNHFQRDRNQYYASDGSASYMSANSANSHPASLLPTINTQIPSGSLMGPPYSPASSYGTPRTSGNTDSSYQAKSPSAYALGSRPYSMYDPGPADHGQGYKSNQASAYQAYQTHRQSPQQASLPLHQSYADNMSPHVPPFTGNEIYSPRQSDRSSILLPDTGKRRERRGTITSADAGINDLRIWDNIHTRPKPKEGFRRVRDLSDLHVNLDPAQEGVGRRADPAGGYVGPLKAMTSYLHHTYHLVNPAFFYELSFNPRRVLTKPSKPMHNNGHDNEDSDYILYVNDWLGTEEGNRYLILDILGQGTFGQVVKCQNMKTRDIVAVKVIKNKPAYFNQSMMEVAILDMLNKNWDKNDEHHILRLLDNFIHAKHLCLVFELLSSNLYELIKQNSFRGLSTSLVRVFTTQLLDALTILNEARLIHCDLKPENILLKTLQTPSIKLVDFGSACHEKQTVYTYIQSRFYRSPEVLLGLPYNSAIDMWSLGCIAVELFLGLPLFPGTSEYNQICRIVEMLGLPPQFMLEQGKQTGEFFNIFTDEYGRRQYKVKSFEQYSREHNPDEVPSKRYFQATTLPEIIKTYPMSRKSGKPADAQKEMANRTAFIDFVSGLLNMDPSQRWTPQQAILHPFITGERFTTPFKPPLSPVSSITRPRNVPSSSSDAAKHPFGGLPDTPSRTTGRTYQDAAAYNQHLAQQQAYNAAHQARQQHLNNPYATDQRAGSSQAKAAAAQAHAAHTQAHAQAQSHAAQIHAAVSPPYVQAPLPPTAAATVGAAAPTNTMQNRSRSNTMTRMDMVPPQLAKLGLDTGSSPIAEQPERRLTGGEFAPIDVQQTSPQLRLSPSQKPYNWPNTRPYGNTVQTSPAMHASPPGSMHTSPTGVLKAQSPQSFSVIVDGHTSSTSKNNAQLAGTQIAAPPPAAYPQSNTRFQAVTQAGNSTQGLGFDPYQSDVPQLMPALQPTQYHQHRIHSPTSTGRPAQATISSSAGVSNRHSIANPHMSPGRTPVSGIPPSASLSGLQGMYSPNSAGGSSGIVPGMLLPTQSNPSASGQGVTGRSDGYGGLSDMMFAGQAHSGHRYSGTAITQPRSPTHGGLPQYHQHGQTTHIPHSSSHR